MKYFLRITLIIGAFLFKANFTFCAISSWIGSTGNWNVATNWSTGMIPDGTTDVIIGVADNVTIPASYTATALSIEVSGTGVLIISTTAILNIDGTPLDAIVIGSPSSIGTINNSGTINIGSGSAIGRNGFVIVGSLTTITNETTGIINLNNITSYAFNMNLFGKIVNKGNINIGNSGPVQSGGFAMDNDAQVDNLSTGTIQINNIPNGDGFYMQNSNVNNNGVVHIGNLQNVQFTGIIMELGSQYSNSSGATTTVSRIINTLASEGIALSLKSSSDFSNNGVLLIGNNGAISNTGLALEFESTFINSSNANVEINNVTNLDGIVIKDQFTNLINSGTIKIGNNASIKRIGIFLSNQAALNNNTSGIINIDNITGVSSSEGYGIYTSSAAITNIGSIIIGTNSAISRFGIFIGAAGTLNNLSSGIIKVNNITNFDGFSITGVNSNLTNNGSILIGNLLAVKRFGIALALSATINANASGSISINNLSGTLSSEGMAINLSGGTFTNSGPINIGNISTVSNVGIFMSGGTFTNQSTGNIQINNILNYDGIQLTGSTTSFTNKGTLKVGNLTAVKNGGISIYASAVFNNNSGTLEINSITNTVSGGYAILLSGNSSFNNNAIINIGNLSNISQIGVYIADGCTFTNNTSGVLNVGRINLFDGFYITGATALLNNSGQIKIGEFGPITRIGMILLNGGKVNNNNGGTIDINNVPNSDAIQISAVGSLFTNNGELHIGTTSGVYRFGVFVSAGTFINNNILTIDNLLSNVASEGVGIRLQSSANFTNSSNINIGSNGNISRFGFVMSSSSIFTNQSTGILQINRIVGQSAISQTTSAKFFNNGNINIGNLNPIALIGIALASASEFNNNLGSTLSINNITNFDGIYIYDVNTKFTNSSVINIGNLGIIGEYGIDVALGALFQNNITGNIQIQNVVDDEIVVEGANSLFINKGLLHAQL